MPLDGHSYLVAQGWSGKGSGLRQGAISRPLAIPQKRTLAGLGKDRDDAFPFWDHVFAVGAKTIQIKLHKDDTEDEGGGSSSDTADASPAAVKLTRTSTGLISHKRPHHGTPASSGSVTPAAEEPSTHRPRMSIMSQAKREVARKGLYSRFFRGPVLAPEIETPKNPKPIDVPIPALPLPLPSVDIKTTQIPDVKADVATLPEAKSKKSKGKEKARLKEETDKKEKGSKKDKAKDDTKSKESGQKGEKKKRSKESACDENDVSLEGKSKKRKRSHDSEDSEKRKRKNERKERRKALKNAENNVEAADGEKRRKKKRRESGMAHDDGEKVGAAVGTEESLKVGVGTVNKDKSKKKKRTTET